VKRVWSQPRLWLARLALFSAALVVFLLGAEVALQRIGPGILRRYPLPVRMSPIYRYREQHPIYGIFHIPSVTSWLWTDEFITRIDVNAHGLREREIDYYKPRGLRRVVVLGDSFTEAQQVDVEEAFARRLEPLLTADWGPTQVINAGATGFGTAQQYLLLNHEALRYEPDVVVVVAYLENDVGENSQSIAGGSIRPFFTTDATGQLVPLPYIYEQPEPRDWRDRLLRESILLSRFDADLLPRYHELRAHVRQVVRGTPPVQRGEDPSITVYRRMLGVFADRETDDFRQAWRTTEALIGAMRDATRVARVPLLLVYAPASFEIYPDDLKRVRELYGLPEDGWAIDAPSNHLAEIAARQAVPYLDLRAALRSSAGEASRLYFPFDRHWTPAGHEVVARAIAAALTDPRLLSSPGL
jgi:hypothetical protein